VYCLEKKLHYQGGAAVRGKIYLLTALIPAAFIFSGCNIIGDAADEMLVHGSPAAVFMPADGAIDIYPHENISITFSEQMERSGWTLNIDGIDYTTGIWSGNKLTIDHEDFIWGSIVDVYLYGFYAESDGSPYSGPVFFSFKIRGDLPTAEYSPVEGSEFVPVDSDIVIVFSEPMNPDSGWSLTADGITYTASSSEAKWNSEADEDFGSSGREAGTVMTVDPAGLFTRAEVVTVVLSGFRAALDSAGLQGAGQFSFTVTPDDEVLTVSVSPGDGAVKVPVDADIKITFSEPMNPGSGWSLTADGLTYNAGSPSNEVQWNTDFTVLTVKPPYTFARPSPVTVALYDFKAEADDASLRGNTVTSFTTRGMPTAVITPADNSQGVLPTESIKISFSEPMDAAGWIVLRKDIFNSGEFYITGYTDSCVNEISWKCDNSSDPDCQNDELIITPSGLFTRDTRSEISLAKFKSPADLQELTGVTEAGFYITDENMPTVSTTPDNNSYGAAVNEPAALRFSEEMDMSNNWMVVLTEKNSDGTIYARTEYDKNSADASWSEGGTKLTVLPPGYFRRGGSAELSLSSFRAAVDNAELPVEPITSRFFVSSVLPLVSQYEPYNGQQNVSDKALIVLRFSEKMNVAGWTVTVGVKGVNYNYTAGTWNTDHTVLTIDPATENAINSSISVQLSGFTAALDGWPLEGLKQIGYQTWYLADIKIRFVEIEYTGRWGEDTMELYWHFQMNGGTDATLTRLAQDDQKNFSQNSVATCGSSNVTCNTLTYYNLQRTQGNYITFKIAKVADDDYPASDDLFAENESLLFKYDAAIERFKCLSNGVSPYDDDKTGVYTVRTLTGEPPDTGWWIFENDGVPRNYTLRLKCDNEGILMATFEITVTPH
jgi:hypothetical protein